MNPSTRTVRQVTIFGIFFDIGIRLELVHVCIIDISSLFLCTVEPAGSVDEVLVDAEIKEDTADVFADDANNSDTRSTTDSSDSDEGSDSSSDSDDETDAKVSHVN